MSVKSSRVLFGFPSKARTGHEIFTRYHRTATDRTNKIDLTSDKAVHTSFTKSRFVFSLIYILSHNLRKTVNINRSFFGLQSG